MKGLITGLTIVTLLLVGSVIGLALLIHYPYLEPLSHRVRETCIVSNCALGDLVRCGRSSCISYHYDYSLVYNDTTNLTKTYYGTTYDSSVCTWLYYIDCYYDDRLGKESFQIEVGNIATLGIFFFSFFTFGLLVFFITLLTRVLVKLSSKPLNPEPPRV